MAEQATLRYFGEVIESAIYVAANPADPDQAFAAALIDAFAKETFPVPKTPQVVFAELMEFIDFSLEPRGPPSLRMLALAYDYESSPNFVGPPAAYQRNAIDQANVDLGQAIAAHENSNRPPIAQSPPGTQPNTQPP